MFAAAAIAAMCTACTEGSFRLASDSRLPRWFSLPAGLKRSDVSVTIRYYTLSGPQIDLIGPGGKVLTSVRGTHRWDPETERRGFTEYPTYSFIKVGDIEEIIEQRSPGDILYIADKVAVADADRTAVLRAEVQRKMAMRNGREAASFHELTELALQAKEYAAASSLATERLRMLHQDRCACYDDEHRADIVLGLAAAHQGDIEQAKSYLLQAGRVGSSPALSTFGPNMALAKDLLERGERDTVIAYLDECARFWSMGTKELTAWKAQIARGETPDFGANLLY